MLSAGAAALRGGRLMGGRCRQRGGPGRPWVPAGCHQVMLSVPVWDGDPQTRKCMLCGGDESLLWNAPNLRALL